MGACGSKEASTEDSEQKKRSQAIDKKLEEDSRRLRRECKILLLGMQDRYNDGVDKSLTILQALVKAESRPL